MNALKRFFRRLATPKPLFLINEGDDEMLRVRPGVKLPPPKITGAQIRRGVSDMAEHMAKDRK